MASSTADFANKEGQDFLVMVDAHSKWPEILPMSSTTAAATIAAFRDVFARFGFPVNVVTENGPQFISAEFSEFLRRNGVKHIRVAPYHPASNGAAERMVQSFKRSVEASASTGAPMRHRLADFLLTYRTTPHAVTGRTPSSLFLGRECRTRLSLLRPKVEESVLKRQAEQVNRRLGPFAEFYVGETVSVRDIRAEAWQTGTIVERRRPKSYVVCLADGRLWRRHVDHLRRTEARPQQEEVHTSQSQSSTDQRTCQSSVQSPEEREAVRAEETREVEPSAAHSQSDLQSSEVGAPAEEPVLRRSSRTTQKPPRLIEEM